MGKKKVITTIKVKATLKEALDIHTNRNTAQADELIAATAKFNSVVTEFSGRKDECRAALEAKYTAAQIALDFGDNPTFMTEDAMVTVRDAETTNIAVNEAMILALGSVSDKYQIKTVKLDKKALMNDYAAGTLDPAIASYVTITKQTEFKITTRKIPTAKTPEKED